MTTLVAFLDLAVCPVSFDAVIFMAQAEMERRKVGAGQLHVVAFGEMRKKSQYDEAEAEWRFANIVIPAARLFGASISAVPGWSVAGADSLAIGRDREWPPSWTLQRETMKDGVRHHLVGGLIERHKAGEKIARPRASEHARRKVRSGFKARKKFDARGIVTMTLRGTYLPERNSDLEAFETARGVIERRGYQVRTLMDTDFALSIGQGFGELNLDLRMAEYEEAAFNIVANTGPASLLWLSDRPYVMLGAGVPADEWDGLFVKQGLALNSQWPWSNREQKLSYGVPSAETIIKAFDDWQKTAVEK